METKTHLGKNGGRGRTVSGRKQKDVVKEEREGRIPYNRAGGDGVAEGGEAERRCEKEERIKTL